MARLDQMAAIANYLNPPAQPHVDPAGGVPNVQIAPGINAAAPFTELTANQKRAFDANRTLAQDQAKTAQDLEQSRQERLQAAMDAAQAEQDAFEKSAQTTVGAIKRIGRGANVRLSSIPLPGGLTLPIVVLLIFFIVLIPVGGHTRLTWLWLVLSGNASIGTATNSSSSTTISEGGSGQTGQQSGNTSAPGNGAVSLPGLPGLPLLSFTGAEDVS